MSKSGDAAIGMMDTAYFVGRGELLDFFNSLLDLQLTKIEQTASGAIACQMTEYIFPRSIPMTRVNWEARSDYEFVQNYKLLQVAFTKHNIQRHVDVDKLIRAKYQDNLEFCQWLKAFYDQYGVVREDYDPSAVRARGKGGKKYNDLLKKTAAKHGSKPLPPNRTRNARVTPTPASTSPRKKTSSTTQPPARPVAPARPVTTRTPITARPTPANATTRNPRTVGPLKATENKTPASSQVQQAKGEKAAADAQLVKDKAALETKVEELETTVMELEKERDFYFGKLRNVELMLQVQQDKNFDGYDLDGVVGNIFKILYATAEEDVAVGDDGEIIPIGESVDISRDHSEEEVNLSASNDLNEMLASREEEDPAGESLIPDEAQETLLAGSEEELLVSEEPPALEY